MHLKTTRCREDYYYSEEHDPLIAMITMLSMLEIGIYYFVKNHFGHFNYYDKLLQLFKEMTYLGAFDQYRAIHTKDQDVLSFTMERLKTEMKCSASFSGLHVPTLAAMHLAGCTNSTTSEYLQKIESMCFEVGEYFQFQKDFLNCYVDSRVTGKEATDIQEGKCTWLAVTCIQRATKTQKEIMKRFYGKDNLESVDRVKQLYDELSIRDLCAMHEEESYNAISRKIQQTPANSPLRGLHVLLRKVCQ